MDFDGVVGRVVCVSGARVIVALDPAQPAADSNGRPRLQKGSIVKMLLPASTVYGMVCGLSIPVPGRAAGEDETRLAELELLGQVAHDEREPTFRRGISAYPSLGDPVLAARGEDYTRIYRRTSTATVHIGDVHQDVARPIFVTPDDLLGKHVAVLGTTGSGKSCAVTALLWELLASHPSAHVLVLDPHNEYRRAFGGRAEVLDTDNLQLPYWLLNFEEISQVVLGEAERTKTSEAVVALLGDLIPRAKAAFRSERDPSLRITVNTPIPYRISDVDHLLDEAMGRLDKPDSLAPYRWLKARLSTITSDSRYGFMFGGITVSDNMARILSRIFRIPVAGKPITILDLSAVPSDIVNVVVSVLCRLTFDFAVWSRGHQPMLLVCDEAHRYAPSDSSLGFEPTTAALARIAKEGRKYSLSLCMMSQRPSELAPSILSQCNTVLAFRMTSARDLDSLRSLINDNAFGLLDFLPSLGDAEAIVAGQAVTVPVRVRLPELPEERRPRSASASFARSWREESAGEEFVQQIVEIWRRQQR